MSTKLTTIEDEHEARRLAAAINKYFHIETRVMENGGTAVVVTDDPEVGGQGLKRIRSYANGWKDCLTSAK